jgi:hypothetical protein
MVRSSSLHTVNNYWSWEWSTSRMKPPEHRPTGKSSTKSATTQLLNHSGFDEIVTTVIVYSLLTFSVDKQSSSRFLKVWFFVSPNRFNDLYRELDRLHIRDSVVRLFLINERSAAHLYNGPKYGKVGVLQDNLREDVVSKLRYHGATVDNYVFGRSATSASCTEECWRKTLIV